MLARAHTIGILLAGIGLAVLLAFAGVAIQNVWLEGEFRQAQLGRERAPGNAMSDLRFFIVATRLEFLIGGAVAGLLLALNGLTLIMLGRLTRQLHRGGR
jgi:hypothetical protein